MVQIKIMREIEEIVDLLLCENTFELGCKILKEDFGCNFYRNPEDEDQVLRDRDKNKGLYTLSFNRKGIPFLFIDHKDYNLLYDLRKEINYKSSFCPRHITTPESPYMLT